MRADRHGWKFVQEHIDRQNDLIAWRNLGLPWSQREPFMTLDGYRRCAHVDNSGHRCELWATHQKGGVKFCTHHKPEGAEKL